MSSKPPAENPSSSSAKSGMWWWSCPWTSMNALVHLNVAEFQRFSDRVGAKAQEAGMTEDVLRELLDRED
ncbi:hypothetical protein WJ970_05165 [Achromobacter xylosoxidans]